MAASLTEELHCFVRHATAMLSLPLPQPGADAPFPPLRYRMHLRRIFSEDTASRAFVIK